MSVNRSTVTALVAAIAILAVGGSSPAYAERDLPSAEEIFAKFVEASGGADAYAKLKNQVTKGTFAFPGMGMEGPMVTAAGVLDSSVAAAAAGASIFLSRMVTQPA